MRFVTSLVSPKAFNVDFQDQHRMPRLGPTNNTLSGGVVDADEMLYLQGKPLSTVLKLQSALLSAVELVKLPAVQHQVEQFWSSEPPVNVERCKRINVIQGEGAAIDVGKESGDVLLSSLEATTCCVVVLACRGSGRYAVGHFDQARVQNHHCFNSLLKGMLQPNLYIAGGYREDTLVGHDTASAILNAAEAAHMPIHLQLAVVDALNTTEDGCPKVCSFGVHVSHQEESAVVLPQSSDKGPDSMARMARQWLLPSHSLIHVYDSIQQAMVFEHVHVQLSSQQEHTFHCLMSLPNKDFLQLMSTSPHHEAATFVPGACCMTARNCIVAEPVVYCCKQRTSWSILLLQRHELC